MNFLQFFIWGAWLITVGNYWFTTKNWNGSQFGAVFSTLGLSSIIMPTIIGIVADKWFNAEKVYGILHILAGITLAFIPQVNDPTTFFWVIFLAMLFYMPTIALSNAIAYTVLKKHNYDVVKSFPPIRVWGTIGFIIAMWITNLSGNKASANMFYFSSISAVLLGIYSFTLPACPSENAKSENETKSIIFNNPFEFFKSYKMAVFFIFSMFLGAALQLTNMYGDTYLSDFGKIPEFADSFIVKQSTIIMSLSQVSETLFILAIPFFLKRFGIKHVMLMSMLAWVLRFALFAFGNPASGLWMIIMSCVVYGMAFDFFNISGSLFIESNTDENNRSSAQGLFMMMTNGFGAVLGSAVSGVLIDAFFTFKNGSKDWFLIWISFSVYALIIMLLFSILFKHDHKVDVNSIKH